MPVPRAASVSAFLVLIVLGSGCSRSGETRLQEARAEAEPARAEQAGPKTGPSEVAPVPQATVSAGASTPEIPAALPPRSEKLVFDDPLTAPEALEQFSCAFGQYGARATVEYGVGMKMDGGHTSPMVWAKPYLGEDYRAEFEIRINEPGWAAWTLNGPGTGNSTESGYWLHLIKRTLDAPGDYYRGSLRRLGTELQAADLPAAVPSGEWVPVRAEFQGGKIAVTVAGHRVIELHDPHPLTGALHGWFGLMAGNSVFRNLRIWSSSAEPNREPQFVPPPTKPPSANGELVYELKLSGETLGPEWWIAHPEGAGVGVDESILILGDRGNATFPIQLQQPLQGDLACEIEFEYPTCEALNLSLSLGYAERPPESPDDIETGWSIGLPNGDGRFLIRWREKQADKGVVATPFYAPLAERKHVARIESRGTGLRVFLDGGLLLESPTPEGLTMPATPAFLRLRQFYSQSLIHGLRIYRLDDGVAQAN